MKYIIEFDLPDNDTVLNNIKTALVGWNVWGYFGSAFAKPKQPERKTGKWIEFPNLMAYKCSECGRIIQTTDGRRNVSKHYPFCHCGADMRKRGEQDD